MVGNMKKRSRNIPVEVHNMFECLSLNWLICFDSHWHTSTTFVLDISFARVGLFCRGWEDRAVHWAGTSQTRDQGPESISLRVVKWLITFVWLIHWAFHHFQAFLFFSSVCGSYFFHLVLWSLWHPVAKLWEAFRSWRTCSQRRWVCPSPKATWRHRGTEDVAQIQSRSQD